MVRSNTKGVHREREREREGGEREGEKEGEIIDKVMNDKAQILSSLASIAK